MSDDVSAIADLLGLPALAPEPGTQRLPPRYERLAELIAKGTSKAQAARECGFKSVAVVSKDFVQARIAVLAREHWQSAQMGTDELLAHVASVVRFDVRKVLNKPPEEIDDDTARALQGVEVEERYDEDGAMVRRIKYKGADKGAAQDKLMKRFGLYAADNAQQSTGRSLAVLLKSVQDSTSGVSDLIAGN